MARHRSTIFALAVAAALALTLALTAGCGQRDAAKVMYHCPMHPTYVSDHPGDCPICGMRLVPIEATPAGAAASTAPTPAPTAHAVYTCPMHPQVVSDKPGKCPICHMDLALKTTADAPSAAAMGERKILFYRNPMDPSITSPTPTKDSMGMDYVPVYADQARPPVPLPGLAPIALEPAALELAGVQTAAAKTGSLGGSIRTIGTVVADETRVRRVQTKVAGYIEKLYVNFTGDVVRRGQPVLDIYSPELLASEREYLQARHTAAEFAKSSLPDIKAGGEELLRAARRRLELFDVPASQIARLEQTGEAPRVVTLTAPVSGYVTAKDALEGQRIEPGTELFAVADLSRVWVNADLYEYEAPRIRVGQRGTLTLTYEPDAPIDARVAYVYPTLNTATRTLTARFDVDNRNLRLKPGMFANVELAVAQEQGVVFPDSAVMDTGKRQIVFVETAPGHFDPREVRVVGRADGMAQVQAGVAAGDKVVTRANFLLDSESRLRAALRDATAGAGQATGQAP